MLKFIIENVILILGGFILLTQIIIPSFVPNLKYWWFFRKAVPAKAECCDEDLESEVEKKTEEFKEVKAKVDENFTKAEELKKKTQI